MIHPRLMYQIGEQSKNVKDRKSRQNMISHHRRNQMRAVQATLKKKTIQLCHHRSIKKDQASKVIVMQSVGKFQTPKSIIIATLIGGLQLELKRFYIAMKMDRRVVKPNIKYSQTIHLNGTQRPILTYMISKDGSQSQASRTFN